MASTDALLAPIKNTAFRMPVGPFFKTDGTVITTWAGMDSEISKDGGNYADCTNEATEIQTSGSGYLDLTSTETNCDGFWLKITISNTDSVPFYGYFATQRAGAYLRADTRELGGTNQTARDIGASVLLSNGTGTGQLKIASGYVAMTWADIAAPTTSVNLSGTTIATTQTIASVSGSVGTVAGNVNGNVVGSVGSISGVTFPTNFLSLAIDGSGHVILQDASLVTAKLGTFALAKTTNITGFNDIAATAIVSGGAITTSGGAVSTVTTLTNLPAITANWLTATGIAADAITAAKIADGAIDTATFASGTTIPRVTLADTVTTYTGNTPQTGDSFARIGATGSGLTSLAPSATALSTAVWTSTIAGRIDVASSTLATSAQAVKLLAACYDSATLSGSTLTLSNAATMVVSSTGRVTT